MQQESTGMVGKMEDLSLKENQKHVGYSTQKNLFARVIQLPSVNVNSTEQECEIPRSRVSSFISFSYAVSAYAASTFDVLSI